MLHLHRTAYRYDGAASPTTPVGMTFIYKDLIASDERTHQIIADVTAALTKGRNCLILTNWTSHLQAIADALRALGHDPITLKGGMGAKDRATTLARLTPQPGGPPLLAPAIRHRPSWLPARAATGNCSGRRAYAASTHPAC